MDESTVLNILAVVISISAVITSTWFGLRQLRIARQTNHIPALIDLLSEFRTVELHEQYAYVCGRLGEENSPELGLSGLPPEAKKAVYSVAYFFQTFAGLCALGIIDEASAIVMVRGRAGRVWRAIEPFVLRERESPHVDAQLLTMLEAFAERIELYTDSTNVDLMWRPHAGRRFRAGRG
jgi:hypothetical protein